MEKSGRAIFSFSFSGCGPPQGRSLLPLTEKMRASGRHRIDRGHRHDAQPTVAPCAGLRAGLIGAQMPLCTSLAVTKSAEPLSSECMDRQFQA